MVRAAPMNALEKIIQKCEFSEQKVWRDCGYDDESEPGVKQIIGGGKAVHSDLMPIIRELCAIVEEQQKALEYCKHPYIAPLPGMPSYEVAQKALASTTKRISRLSDSEGV